MFESLEAALVELADLDPMAMSDGELSAAMVEGRTAMARLAALVSGFTAVWDTRGSWVDDDVRSAGAWLVDRCGISPGEARQQLRHARLLRQLPLTAAAFAAGEIGVARVRVLLGAVSVRTIGRYVEDEQVLVEQAKTLHFDDLVTAVRYWSQLADPDGCERSAEEQAARRHLDVAETLDGMSYGRFALPAVEAAIVSDALHRIEQELFDADWRAAKERFGEVFSVDQLSRTPTQRRADALVEMATRAMTAPANGQRPAPLFTALVDYPTLVGRVCELASGHALTPGQLAPWMCEAALERVVFDTPSRVIDVGATRRLFKGALRRAVQVRDRHCRGPGCRTPAERCDVDHIDPYNGRNTTQANGQCSCDWHNGRKGRQRPPSPPSGGDGELDDNEATITDGSHDGGEPGAGQ